MNKSVLVTGATGFIGGRVCERLVQEGLRAEVRALVHNVQHAARIATLPIQLCTGNLLDVKSLHEALGDARVIVHLGLGYGSAIVKGVRNLLEVARAAKVERFVHVSTTAVYGLKPSPGCECEEAPARPTGNVYCDSKLHAERIVRRFARRGLPAVILRPSIVYGPYSRWSTGLVERLRAGRGLLIDDGAGICNVGYVDNVVDAILLALEVERAVGKTFSVTDGEAVTWGEFIRAHAAMVQPEPSLSRISSEEILQHYRGQAGFWRRSYKEARFLLTSPEFRELIRRIPACDRILTWAWMRAQGLDQEAKDRLLERLAGAPTSSPSWRNDLPVPDLDTWAIQTGRVMFRIDKAKDILGYKPRIRFAQGLQLTEQWLRFANYI